MTSNYFQDFNYSLANEDTSVEKSLSLEHESLAAVCGSGLRALGLVSRKTKVLDIFDISVVQLNYAELHWISIRTLNYEDYLKFFGFKSTTLNERIRIFNYIKEKNGYNPVIENMDINTLEKGLIYSGRWESFIIRLGEVVRFFLDYDFYPHFLPGGETTEWPERRLLKWIKLLAPVWLLNLFLYKGGMAKSNHTPLAEFITSGISKGLKSSNPRSSFWHQLLLLGKIEFQDAIDLIMSPTQFELLKNFEGAVRFHQMDMIDAFKKSEATFWSCSDVLSYLTPEKRLELQDAVARSKATDIVFRTFMRHPDLTIKEFKLNRDLGRRLIEMDRTGLYQFQVFEKIEVIMKYQARLNLWLNERFPPINFISGLFVYLLAKVISGPNPASGWILDIVAALIPMTHLFILRVYDEVKDFESDKINYPDRVIQKGIFRLDEVKILGYGAEIINGLSFLFLWYNFGFKNELLFAYSLLWIWTLLMRYEFFVKDWLKKQFIVYSLSHLVITPILFLFCLVSTGRDIIGNSAIPWALGLSFLTGWLYEITRKTKGPDEEKLNDRSYSQVFGVRGAVWVIGLSLVVTHFFIWHLFSELKMNDWFYLSLGPVLLLLSFLSLKKFSSAPGLKQRKNNEKTVALATLFAYLTPVIFWTLN